MNFLYLYLGHLKSSRRILFLSSIGLISALIIFSSTAYYVDNSKKQILDDYFGDSGFETRTDISIRAYSEVFPINNQIGDQIDALVVEAKNELKINFFKNTSRTQAITELFGPSIGHYAEGEPRYDNRSLTVFELTPGIEKELVELNKKNSIISNSILPSDPNQPNEVYLLSFLYFDPTENITNSFNLTNSGDNYTFYDNWGNEGNSYNVAITGASEFGNNYYFYADASSGLEDYPQLARLRQIGYPEIFIFTRDLQKFSEVINKVKNPFDSFERFSAISVISININFDWNKIDVYNTGPTIKKIQDFNEKILSKFYETPFSGGFYVNSNSEWILRNAQTIANGIIYGLLMISLPIIIITVFVTNYSFGLVHKNIVRQIGIFKTRGANSNMIFLFQLIDSILVIIFAIIAGAILGIPLTYFVLKTDFLLSFNYPNLNFYVFNFQAIGDLLIYTAIFITLLTNSSRVKKLARITIFETENPTELVEPSWKRHYWDFILFGYGMFFYISLYLIVNNPDLVYSFGAFLGIFFFLAIPSPFALIIGLILISNRFVPRILNKIGTILWVKTGGLIAFALKNVIRHQQASTRAVMLMATLLAFVIAFYSLPLSGIVYNEQSLYYKYGAEGSALFGFGGSALNQTDLNTIENNYSQYLESYSPFMILESDVFTLMLINTSTYLTASYTSQFDLGLQRNSINSVMDKLTINNINASGFNLIIDESYIIDDRYQYDGNITVFSYNKNQDTQKFIIIDSFKNWPVLKQNFWERNIAVADIGYFTKVLNQSFGALGDSPFSIRESGILFNFKSGINDEREIANWIEGNTSIIFNGIVSEKQQEYLDGSNLRLQIGQVNNNVIMTFIISIIVLVMFSYLQLSERKREIYTERALGMKLKQISALFFIETMVLMVTAIVLGTSLGVLLMQMLSIFITQSNTYPIYTIILPLDLISLTNGILIVLSIIASLIPAYYVSKQDISKGFAGEM